VPSRAFDESPAAGAALPKAASTPTSSRKSEDLWEGEEDLWEGEEASRRRAQLIRQQVVASWATATASGAETVAFETDAEPQRSSSREADTVRRKRGRAVRPLGVPMNYAIVGAVLVVAIGAVLAVCAATGAPEVAETKTVR
jgi:hypothetical protein